MDDAKQQLIEKLTGSNNILVTVSRNPSVDQLASCIGLTLLLNKQGKHAAAVFSGKVPSTLEFLQPDDTLEKNTDSLRDFIISLDKAKADKLRYKVEEDVVRIFITPYKTSLSQEDLEFSEGDFNVDVVVALGVQKQEDLDQAITAHGRILHDATVASLNTSPDAGLGTINWYDPQASSLSELVTDLAQALDASLLDAQIATALLTGIVSETGRFSNDKTSSQTMSASAALMSAGANQQLVASKLEATESVTIAQGGQADLASQDATAADGDGVLNIDHVAGTSDTNTEGGLPDLTDTAGLPPEPEIAPEPPNNNDFPAPEPALGPTSEQPQPGPGFASEPEDPASTLSTGPKLVTEPPTLGGTLTANSQSEQLDPVTDPLSMPSSEPPQLLGRKDGAAKSEPPSSQPPTPAPAAPPANSKKTDDISLTDLEKSVGSPHADPASLDTVRGEIDRALSGSESSKPIAALNAQPFGDDLHASQPSQPAVPATGTPAATPSPAGNAGDNADLPKDDSKTNDPDAPPPVPPPIPFQFGNSPPPQ